jgi:hypothetical protein
MSLALYPSRVRSSEVLGGRGKVPPGKGPGVSGLPSHNRIGRLENTSGNSKQPPCVFVGAESMPNVARNAMLNFAELVEIFEAHFR